MSKPHPYLLKIGEELLRAGADIDLICHPENQSVLDLLKGCSEESWAQRLLTFGKTSLWVKGIPYPIDIWR
jgi:hypothetical protein